ncbi:MULTISPECIES: hypothetical protein [unclassified Brevibacterium]|uniref:hypothetical protein n=1 Tax=unclassified Brevibacterium TaxID=2614124 RepID=UPI0010925D14|nr:hypothetical protein [Brevibacterium sp. S22]TGD31781.1 hypothetical protein EB835_06900 [Brevibacterium sp. S22]
MPVSHRFSRRAAAIGAALALAALPISATLTPALAQPSPPPTAEAGSNADAETSAGADSTSGDGADPTADSEDGTEADSNSADNGVTEVDGKDDDSDSDPDEDGACADSDQGSSLLRIDQPCEIDGELEATWDSETQHLSVKPNNGEPGSLPKSWVGVKFDGPTDQGMVRVPAQSASSDGTGDSASSESDTDDSGQSVSDATTQADAPTRFEFGPDGTIRAAGEDEAMEFKGFGTNGPKPDWKFKADGKKITASGEQYKEHDEGAEASADKDGSTSDDSETGADNGTADNGSSSSDDESSTADGSESNTRGDKTASRDGITSDNGSADDRGADEDGSTSDSDTSDDSASSTDGGTSSDSGAKDRANTSGDKDSDGKESDTDTGSASDGSRDSDSDGSRSSDSDTSGSDSGSDEDEEKDADTDGSGSSVGASDADGTTPDPANGNGTPDERETIPGNAGDEWLPGDDDDSEHPDYSDPVPRNPDEQTPKDDTDLITGGDQPSPRANQNPATSFGESIISTIVSSWPIFVLAASGMAAVGFIIYLMGRRGKQD